MVDQLRRALFVVSGWYGMGHLEPMIPVAEELGRDYGFDLRLMTTAFEWERLARHGRSDLFSGHFLLEECQTSRGLDEYLRRHGTVNRLRLACAVQTYDPSVVVFHWSVLLPIADRSALHGRCVVAVMERNEWGMIVLGADDEYGAINKIIYADEVNTKAAGSRLDDHRLLVGPLARPPRMLKPSFGPRRSVLVSSGGGARVGNRLLLSTIPDVARMAAQLSFEVLVGPMIPDNLVHHLRAEAALHPNLSLHFDPKRELIESLLDGAHLAVNNGGIGSSAECLVRGIPFVALDPVGNERENDRVRVRDLERQGWCRVLDSGDGRLLAKEVVDALNALLLGKRKSPIASGISPTARAIAGWATDPQSKNFSDLNYIVLIVSSTVSVEIERAAAEGVGGQHVRLVVLRLSVPRASTRSFDDRLRVQRAVLVGQSYANLRVVAVVDHRSDRAELQALECPVPIEVLDVSGLTPEDVARVLLARVHGGPDANSEVVLPEPETFENLVEQTFNPFQLRR